MHLLHWFSRGNPAMKVGPDAVKCCRESETDLSVFITHSLQTINYDKVTNTCKHLNNL